MHYQRKRRYGGVGPVGRMAAAAPIEIRFQNNVQLDGPLIVPALGICHEWTGPIHRSGFGVIGHGHRLLYAHRYAWELAYGTPPAGQIRQLCGNRVCVRPDHLMLVKTLRAQGG